jgi:hypothetical protein
LKFSSELRICFHVILILKLISDEELRNFHWLLRHLIFRRSSPLSQKLRFFHCKMHYNWVGQVAQSVYRMTTGWRVRGSNPCGARFSAVQTGPGTHPASCTMGTGSFPGVKCGWGVLLTIHPLLMPRSRKGRAIPLSTLEAI